MFLWKNQQNIPFKKGVLDFWGKSQLTLLSQIRNYFGPVL